MSDTIQKLGGFNLTASEMVEKLRNSGFRDADTQRIVLALVALERVPTAALLGATTDHLSESRLVDARTLRNYPTCRDRIEEGTACDLVHHLLANKCIRFEWGSDIEPGDSVKCVAHFWLLKGPRL